MITPVVTPRFVISCTSELMKQLGHVSEKYNVPIQVWLKFQISFFNKSTLSQSVIKFVVKFVALAVIAI